MTRLNQICHSKITECPGECPDGKLRTQDEHGDSFTRPCHLLSKTCAYGKKLRRATIERFYSALAESQIPKIHKAKIRNNAKTQITAEVKKWDWNEKPLLMLIGKNGVGKSFGAAYAYSRWALGQYGADDWRSPETCSKLEQNARNALVWLHTFEMCNYEFKWSDQSGAYKTPQWLTSPFLVLDDLATEDATDGVKSKINYVLCKRYDMQLPTVITSNLTFDKFTERYGDRIGYRIAECGFIAWIQGDDLRAQETITM